jgi:phosphate transport system protein
MSMTAHFVNLLDDLRRRSLRMASAVEDMLQEASEAAFQRDHTLARRVIGRDEEVDHEEVEVESEAIRLMALYQPMGSDLRLLCTVLKVNNDLERIADCAVNIAERARHIDPAGMVSESSDVKEMVPMVRRMLRGAVQSYASSDADAAQAVLAQDESVDAVYAQIIRRIVSEAPKSPYQMALHLDMLSIAKNLERVADHATNIAEDVIFLSTGRIVRHSTG